MGDSSKALPPPVPWEAAGTVLPRCCRQRRYRDATGMKALQTEGGSPVLVTGRPIPSP